MRTGEGGGLSGLYHANAAIAFFLHTVLSGVLVLFLLGASQPTNAALAILLKALALLIYLALTAAGVWLWRRGSPIILMLAPVSVGAQVVVVWIGNELVSWVIQSGSLP